MLLIEVKMMHDLLEQYLEEVASQLKSLPAKRREEELREIREHLLTAIIVNQETGMTEAEAVQKVLEQFGSPNSVAYNMVMAWRWEDQKRGEKLFGVIAVLDSAVFILGSFRDPPVIRLIPMVLALLVLIAWQSFSPRYAPAWWAYRKYSDDFAHFRFSAVCYFIIGLLVYFVGVPFYIAFIIGMLMASLAWLEWCRNMRNSGTGSQESKPVPKG
jgi:uncharacterized membrane protein